MNTANITDTMTTGQAYMYRYHRAEARRLATYARECDDEGRATMARLHRERAAWHLVDAKSIMTKAVAS
jgi:hypothetical protein